MKNKYLFELGTEEIPADMIPPALDQLKNALQDFFEECEVSVSEIRTFSTSRRLAAVVEGLPDRQEDRQELITGPPRSVAFDAEDQPTAAARGFASKMQCDLDQLERVETEKGEYLAFRRQLEGKEMTDLLREGLPGIIASLSWPKNMYWRESRFRFIRPLRWYVSLWNDQVVKFSFEGVQAGRTTRGHRSLGRKAVELDRVDSYLDELRANFVLPDLEERRKRIEEGLAAQVTNGYRLIDDPSLLQTVLYLNEYPTVIRGEFDREFLNIPEEVLITVMRFHQKYFAVRDESGVLAPFFLTVINTKGDPTGGIRRGHEKVLKARLEDAAFFWDVDRKKGMAERVEMLGHVLFQENLGTYLDKTKRIETIVSSLSSDLKVVEAARLCKADLTTDMVRELTELQGIMGGLYACQEGYPEEVWTAIYDHYKPVSLDEESPRNSAGALLSIADRIDTIAGCFAAGIIPSGSSDPFALRRQGQGLVKILLDHDLQVSLSSLVDLALENFPSLVSEPDALRGQLLDFLGRRVRFVFQSHRFPYDVLNAVFAAGVDQPIDGLRRAQALQGIRHEEDFAAVAGAYKRMKNILTQAGDNGPLLRTELLKEPEERELHQSFERTQPVVEELCQSGEYERALKELARLRTVVDRFFDTVLVMTPDQEIRQNRLALLEEIAGLFSSIADISEIVREGGTSSPRDS